MAFNLKTFGTLGGQVGRGSKFQLFSYISTDTYATVLTDDYFADVKGKVSIDDVVWIRNRSGDNELTDFCVRFTVVGIDSIETERCSIPLELANTLGFEDTTNGTAGTEETVSRSDHSHPKTVATETVRGQALLATQAQAEAYTNDTRIITPLKNEQHYQIHKATQAEAEAGTETEQWISPATMQDHYLINKATQAEAEAGTEDTQYMTPDKTDDFYQIRKSSDAEVQTGTDTNKFITPAGLSSRTALETRTGIAEIATQTETDAGTDDTRFITPLKHALYPHAASIPVGHINGFVPVLDTDTDHDIDFGTGYCKSSDGTTDFIVTVPLIKQIDAAWATGTNAGGFPTGASLPASGTVYLFELKNTTLGTYDAGYDTDIDATNLLVDATGFDKYRRTGSILTDASSNIIAFTAYEKSGGGLDVELLDKITITTNPISGTYSISTPAGIITKAKINVTAVPTNALDASISIKLKSSLVNTYQTVCGGRCINHNVTGAGFTTGGTVDIISLGSIDVSKSGSPMTTGSEMCLISFEEERL